MASDAVGAERVSRVVGYEVTPGNFQVSSPYLPQRIAILGEANTDNQGTLITTAKQVTTSQQAGNLYGYGSPIHQICRILLPISGDGVGGIPVIIYPQAQAPGATSKIIKVTPSGVATGNGTHTLKISGRGQIDGEFYAINIVQGDTTSQITAKMRDAVNKVLGAPVKASWFDYETRFESKWKGLTSNELNITVDTGDDDLGITYVVAQIQAGSGTPSISGGLDQFQNEWNTIVVNSYGTVAAVMTALEQFNGRPSLDNPTGRWVGTIFKPFIALTGSVLDDPSNITDTRSDDVTIAICPAPNSTGFSYEAAANMCVLFARICQNTPHLDVGGKTYPDMPTPAQIGSMSLYNNRDAFVKKGCSTVSLSAGRYMVEDFVTTYHPLGENPPQYRYCRNLDIHWNIRYMYFLNEQIYVRDKAIANDQDIVTVSDVIKPKTWKGIVNSQADIFQSLSLIVDSKFMKDSITVNISTVNPDRLETFFRYKISGTARISATTAEAGFNFGTLN